MKRLVSFFLAVLMLMMPFVLTACGGDETTGSGDVTDPAGSTSSLPDPPDDPVPGTGVGIYAMKTDDFVNPLGIDTPTPSFSWKMASDVVGQKQTAYQIFVKTEDGKTVWDSGTVSSALSVDIPYEGETLTSGTRYHWQVAVWDKDGTKTLSPVASLETAFLYENEYADTKFISAPAQELPKDTVYTVDFDFILESGSMGFAFGATDTNNMLMWQINNHIAPGQRIYLRPHAKTGGNWATLTSDIDITAKLPVSAADFAGSLLHFRLEVSGRTIRTYIGKTEESLALVHTYTYTKNVPLNKLAFRQHANEDEVALFDNLVVKNEAGEVIYQNDFSETIGFEGSVYGVLENGMLKVGTSQGSDEHILLQSDAIPNLPGFRKTFTPKGEVKSARWYTCGLGVYEAYVNGKRVGFLQEDGGMLYPELKPGFTEMAKRKSYVTFDVTDFLKTGENVLAAVVTSGWWSGQVAASYGKTDAFWGKLVITYADGSSESIATGGDWKTARVSALLYADIFGGETYDARVSDDWMKPGYDDSAWDKVVINREYTGKIQAWKGSFIVDRADLERPLQSVTVYAGADGTTAGAYGKIHVLRTGTTASFTLAPGEVALIDFAQNASGWECFTVEGPAGTLLTIRHGEILNDNNGETSRGNDGPGGSVYNANYRTAAATTRYYLKGEGKESYHPAFTFYGFRYIEITATAPVTFSALSAHTVTSVEEDTGFMTTSDEKINQLFSNIRWGQYSNYLSVPTDCPQRDERQGWTADTQVFAPAGCYLGFSKSFLEKFMQDLMDAQAADGSYPGTAPTGSYNGGGWGGTGWADAGIIVPYTLYQMYNDVEVIKECWDSMQQYVDGYLASFGKRGPANIWGDWLAYESNDAEIQSLLAVAYYAWDAKMMAEMADALGLAAEAERYLTLYEEEKEYFIESYVNPTTGRMKRSEQTACLYALYLDLLPDEASVQAVTAQLLTNIKSKGNRLQTGFLGTKIILDTLTKIGHSEVAYTLLLQENNPSWLYSVLQGATTIWERWNSYTLDRGFGDVGMNSFNHYAYGAVAYWMFNTMAGIGVDPAAPGFGKMIIAPVPDVRIGKVEASYESCYGKVAVTSDYSETAWDYTLTLPANTSAEIRLPMGNFKTLTVNGKALDALTLAEDGIEYLGTEDGVARFHAVSGSFAFAAR